MNEHRAAWRSARLGEVGRERKFREPEEYLSSRVNANQSTFAALSGAGCGKVKSCAGFPAQSSLRRLPKIICLSCSKLLESITFMIAD
ncbi:MAG: hypothetical protein ACLPID_18735 [Beijerinckiaceae bacterium]